jgi:Putative adhesin
MTSPTLTPPPAPTPRAEAAHRSAVHRVRWTGAIVVAALVLAGTGNVLSEFFTQSETRTVPVSAAVSRVVSDLTTGDVHVRTGPPGQAVEVRATLRWAFRRPTVVADVRDGVLSLSSECPSGGFPFRCSVDYAVTVPQGTALDLLTTTGEVSATLTGGAAPVTARTTTGDVTVTGLGNGPVAVRTTTGNVSLRGDGSGTRVQAETTTGDLDVRLDGVPTAVSAITTTGNVSVQVPDTATGYRVDTRSQTSTPRVSVPRNDSSTHTLTARTSTGDLHLISRPAG